MRKTLVAALAVAIGLSFGMATFAKADEKKPAPTTEKKDEKKDSKKTEKK